MLFKAILDVQAMDDECAEESWVWIYVFTVVAVPTIIGSILKSPLFSVSDVVNILALTLRMCSRLYSRPHSERAPGSVVVLF